MAAKSELRERLEIGTFFIPVVVFPDMEPDDNIIDELRGRKVRVLWGMERLVERLVEIPEEGDLYGPLNQRFIDKELEVLTQQQAGPVSPAAQQMTFDLPDPGRLVLQQVDVVNIYITVEGNDRDSV